MIDDIFSNEVLKEIRLFHGGSWIFKGNQYEIVCKELTHQYLLNNFKVPDLIREYYFSPCLDMLSDEEFKNLKSHGYAGEKRTTLDPYPFSFNGAFIQRKQLYYNIMHLMHRTENYDGKPVKKFIDLFPYFEDYSNGFKSGFESFEEECIKKFLPMFPDKSDFVSKTFEYVTKHIIFNHSWKNNHSGFSVSQNINVAFDNPGEITSAFKDGKSQGYFYKAWTIILSNTQLA